MIKLKRGLAALLSIVGGAALAAPDIKSSIVKVVATAIDVEAGNVQRVATGTGFFTSEIGFVVTSAHLKRKLGKVDEASISYEIYLDRFNATGIPASFQYISDPSDLLVLYAPVGGDQVKALNVSRRPISSIKLGETPVFTAGYPEGYGYTVNQGVITAFSGPVRTIPLWATNLTFKEGQSGSPVYLENGEVIGIVKGVDRAAPIGLLVPARTIPSNYLDSALNTAVLQAAASQSAEMLIASTTQIAGGPRERTERAQFVNPQCTESKRHIKTILPSTGWTIDRQSIKLKAIAIHARSVEARVDAVSEGGFHLIVDIENAGKCINVSGIPVSRDSSGKYVGEVTFREVPQPSAEERYNLAEAVLVPGAKIPLGNIDPTKVVFTIDGPNGIRNYVPKPGELITERGQSVLRIPRVTPRQ